MSSRVWRGIDHMHLWYYIVNMTMDYQSGVGEVLVEWQGRLDLNHWDIEVKFDLDNDLANCEAQPEYLSAIIRFNTTRLEQEIQTYKQLEELVVHELVHCRIWALANVWVPLDKKGVITVLAGYLEEEATSQITGALLRAKYNEG